MLTKISDWIGHRSAAALAAIALVPMVVIASVLTTLLLRESASLAQMSLSWFIVSYGMLVTMIGMFLVVTRNVKGIHDQLIVDVGEHLKAFNVTLNLRLSTDVRVLRTKDEVRLEAARMFLGLLDPRLDGNRMVIYYGAANLMPSKDDLQAAEDSDGKQLHTPPIVFKMAYDKILSSDAPVQMIRYIRPFDESEFSSRSKSFRDDFLLWMNGQLDLLKSTDSYEFALAARAPEWGSTTSMIVAGNSVLLMVGQGTSAIFLRGFEVAKEITEHAREYMEAAGEDLNRPQVYRRGSVNELRQHLVARYGEFSRG